MLLSSPAQSGLMKLPKLLKKLSIPIIFCLLGFAILSNRFLLLRQFRFSHHQQAGFHLPLDSAEQPRSRTILLATTNEDLSELGQLARDSGEVETDSPSALQDFRVPFKFQTPISLRPPTYILQSALNL
jgi:hypothetical protein